MEMAGYPRAYLGAISGPTLSSGDGRRDGQGGAVGTNGIAMGVPEGLRLHLGPGTGGAVMSGATVDAALALLAASDLTIVDLDGPPPELHPRFREIVILVRALRRRLVHRCNLAVAAQPEHDQLPELLADHRVEVVAA